MRESISAADLKIFPFHSWFIPAKFDIKITEGCFGVGITLPSSGMAKNLMSVSAIGRDI